MKGLKGAESMPSTPKALQGGVGPLLVADVVDDVADDGVGLEVSALTRACVVSIVWELIARPYSDEVGGRASHKLFAPI